MDIDKELEEIFDDPLLRLNETEQELFDIPQDMRSVIAKKAPDYVAQHKLCENFAEYKPLFLKVHKELKEGRRMLVRLAKTSSIEVGQFFVVSGQIVFLESMDVAKWTENVRGRNARTRCIYENGTEANILLQTLRKSVMTDGYIVTESSEQTCNHFFKNADITPDDKVTGYVYVLSSLSKDPDIRNTKNLFKIGFSSNSVEERISNAENEPTYLMSPVKIVATYKVVNMNSQKFEDLVHQLLKAVQFRITVYDKQGIEHHPKEWFVVPLSVVDVIIKKIMDGSILGYTYNPQMECLEKIG